MRIPYEGLLASEALVGRSTPLVISVWGNDFTLHAARSLAIGWMTRRAMARCDALHPDCERDLRLASASGFASDKPYAILPGNGGLDTGVFCPGDPGEDVRLQWSLPRSSPLVLNPRGIRPYVRNDTFFKAVPLVLARVRDAHFACVGMAGNDFAESYVRRLGVHRYVTLLPQMSSMQMRDLFRAAAVSVSPSEHDGTPNTLLEAMACGSFPIAGNLDSIREWVRHGENGLLCDPGVPEELSEAICRALHDPALREVVAHRNTLLIHQRADSVIIRKRSLDLYRRAVESVKMRTRGIPGEVRGIQR